MMKPTGPAILRAVEHVLTGYADRVMTQEQVRRGADATPPRAGARVDELLIRRPRRFITHAELIAVANQFLDDLADGIAPPLGKTLTFDDTPPQEAPADDDEP
jgi:hypothetical protein